MVVFLLLCIVGALCYLSSQISNIFTATLVANNKLNEAQIEKLEEIHAELVALRDKFK
jgi:hypothetical protein